MKYRILLTFVLALLFCAGSVFAKSEYIYRQRVNWVKIIKAPPKDVPLGSLDHPYTSVTAEQMEAMLLSIKISKRYLLKKTLNTIDVFNSWEARMFSPFIVEALAKADPDHVVHLSVVHKRPLFILRNDRLSMANIWVDAEGIHFQFTKLFAKLSGDYEASAYMDKELKRSKTMRITLEANEGQKLSYQSATEIILDPNFDFITGMKKELEEKKLAEEEEMKAKSERKKEKKEKASPKPVAAKTETKAPAEAEPAEVSPEPAEQESSTDEKSVNDRLRDLNDLKKEGLISKKEYEQLRKKILSEI